MLSKKENEKLARVGPGTPATLVFNGYGRFDMTEMTWGIGEGGYASAQERPQGKAPAKYAEPSRAETRRRASETTRSRHSKPVRVRRRKMGQATLEVVLAILQSSREGREITLSHQVPCIA